MLDEIRRNLGKATDELIESFVNFDKNKALHLKVGLDAIHHAQRDIAPEKKVNLYSVCDQDLLNSLLEQHGVPREDFEKIPEFIESKKFKNIEVLALPLKEALYNISANIKPNYEVPTQGMVAVMFNMVEDKVKNALMAGQAGERTLKALERATTVSHIVPIKDILLRDTLYDLGSTKRPARSYIGNGFKEPDYLTSAKATHHLADLFEISLRLHPIAQNFADTVKSISGFSRLAAHIFRNAADQLSSSSVTDAAKKIHALAAYVEGTVLHEIKLEEACDVVDSGMKTLRESMYADGIITQEESQDYQELVSQRIEQIKKMEMMVG